MLNFDSFKRKIKNKQMKKVVLKFWNNMIILSVILFFLIGNFSTASKIEYNIDSYNTLNENIECFDHIYLSVFDSANAYTLLSLKQPYAKIKNLDQLSLSDKKDFEVKSEYDVITHFGSLKVTLTNHINLDTGEIEYKGKKIIKDGIEITESEDEVLVLSNGELTRLSVSDKSKMQKFICNSIELLVDENIIEKPFFSGKKEFVVMTDKKPDFPYDKKIFETDNYQFYLVRDSDINVIINSDSIVKISELKDIFLDKFIKFSKDILRADANHEIKRLELKKTTNDCLDPKDLKDYLNEDGWDIKPGQHSPYQQFVTPNDLAIKEISQDKSIKEIYDLSVDWVWISDHILHKKSEKWLLPNEFILKTPYYKTNPSQGIAASDCSEQANTLVSLLRANGVSAEDVRVVIGKVDFEDSVGGHAWVEIKEDGRWMVLEPTSGPFYDGDRKTLVDRNGVDYNYWKYHPYPVVEVWCYYNDVYYTDECEDVANGWSNQYDVFTGADILAGFLFEDSIDYFFIFSIIGSVLVISFVLIGSIRRRELE